VFAGILGQDYFKMEDFSPTIYFLINWHLLRDHACVENVIVRVLFRWVKNIETPWADDLKRKKEMSLFLYLFLIFITINYYIYIEKSIPQKILITNVTGLLEIYVSWLNPT